MPSIRNLPKSLALLAALALGLAVGCGGSDKWDAPAPPVVTVPGDAALKSLSVSRGQLAPAFRPAVTNYGLAKAFIADPGVFAVTASSVDSAARLTLAVAGRDSVPMAQGVPVTVQLNVGYTNIRVMVETAGGATSATDLQVDMARPNVAVEVLDGIGGAYVEGATVAVRDSMGRLLQDDIPLAVAKNGKAPLISLVKGSKYDIYAKGPNNAEGCFARFDMNRMEKPIIYCLPAGPTANKSAPIITGIDFATNNTATSTWNPITLANNYLEGTTGSMTGMRISIKSKVPVVNTGLPGIPAVKINMDGVAWWGYDTGVDIVAGSGGVSGTAVEEGVTVGDGYYRSTYRFTVPWDNFRAQDRWMSIAVRDSSNNRTDMRLWFHTTTAPTNNTTDDNILTDKPIIWDMESTTYGVTRYMPGINPVPGYGAYCENTLTFSVGPNLTYNNWYTTTYLKRIRGFEVYRSTTDKEADFRLHETYTFNGTEEGDWDWALYPDVNNGNATLDDYIRQLLMYVDQTDLEDGVTYYYKIRAFNRRGYSLMSDAIALKPMPAFVTLLSQPAHNAVSQKAWPTFRFRVNSTDPKILTTAVSSEFVFMVYLKPVGDYLPVFDFCVTMYFEVYNSDTGKMESMLDEEGNPFCVYWDNMYGGWWPTEYEYEYDTGQKDEEGNPIMATATDQTVWLEDNGVVAVATDNPLVKTYVAYENMKAASVYEWSVFGYYGGIAEFDPIGEPTDAAFFVKNYAMPAHTWRTEYSFGSDYEHGLGSPNGWFTLITADGAK